MGTETKGAEKSLYMGILVISGGGGWWVNSFEDERKHWGYLDDEVNLSLCFLFFHINMG